MNKIDEQTTQLNKKRLVPAQRIFFFVLILCMLGISFVGGYSARERGFYIGIGNKTVTNTETGKPTSVDFAKFWEAWNLVQSKSALGPDSTKMTEGSIAGMLASVNDPYTVYFSKAENQRFHEDIQGAFYGIGIEIIQKNMLPTVVAPLADMPAEKAGIKAGDIIIEVDSQKTADLGFDETINKIRGADGTKVNIKVVRENVTDPLSFDVVRSKITVKSVEWDLKTIDGKKIEYIKLRQFGDDTEFLFSNAVADILKNKPEGIILDLRNDPGGYLETSVNLASYFVKDGVIVSEKGKNDAKKEYTSTGNGKLANYKTVILANGGSASASEIMAGALQDRLGIKMIGEKTFGKGSVQELVNLSDGSAVKITVASWYTPSGRQINKQGLEPDIKILDDEKTTADEQLDRAMQYLSTGK